MKARQQGMLLIAAVILILLAGVLAAALVSMNTGGVQSGVHLLGGTQAVSIAESGLERGIMAWGANPAYVGQGPDAMPGGSYVIKTYTTDFSGLALPGNEVRVSSAGTAVAVGAMRTVEAIVGPPSLVPPWANMNFNQPPGVCSPAAVPPCAPTGWVLGANPNTYTPWDDYGGTNGSRAAYVYKATAGPSTATSAGSYAFSPPFTVTGPIVLTVAFDYRVEMLGPGGAPNELGLNFTLYQPSPGTGSWASTVFQSGATTAFVHASVTVNVSAAGPVQIGQLSFNLTAKAGQPTKIWLDNLTITAPGQQPASQIISWREVLP